MSYFEDELQRRVLEQARDTYGTKSQLFVCMGELGELISVLAKFPRYDDENQAIEELRSDVIDEVADVYVVLEHIKSIVNISEDEIRKVKTEKIGRLSRWLSKGSSLQISITDRELNTTDTNTET